MNFWIWLILGAIFVLGIGLSIGYFVARKMIGKSAASQNLKKSAPILIFSLLFGIFLGVFLVNAKGPGLFFYFSLFFLTGTTIFILHSFFKKQWAGDLLHKTPLNSQNKFQIGIGIFQVIFGFLGIFLQYQSSQYFERAGFEFSINSFAQPIFLLTCGAFFIFIGFSSLEVRQNGIYVNQVYANWKNVRSFKFDPIKQNTLRVDYKSDLPFIPGTITYALSDTDKMAVEAALRQKIPSLELAI
jgi:hypothetical protein